MESADTNEINRAIHLADTLFKLENNMYFLVQLSSKEYIEKVKTYIMRI